MFRSETERIGHLLTGHGVEVREEEEGEGEGATPHPFILPRSHTEEEQDQLGEYLRTVRYVMRSAWWNLCHGCYKGGNHCYQTEFRAFFYSAKRFGQNTESLHLFLMHERNSELFFLPRNTPEQKLNGILSCFLFREMLRNKISKGCFYYCSTARDSEHFSLPRKGSEGNSQSFLCRGKGEIRPEITNRFV